jgi:hypothetical protein
MKQIVFLLLCLSVSLSSCLKDSQEFIPNNETGDVNALLQKIDDFTYSVTINPIMDNTIITASNDVIFIPANAIRNSDNSLVEGTVLLTYGINKSAAIDIVRNRDSNVGENNEANLFNLILELSQGNKKLTIGADSKGISFKVPYNTSENQVEPNLYIRSNNNWIPENNSKIFNTNWKLEMNNGTIFGIGYETNVKTTGDFMVAVPTMLSGSWDICLELPDIYTNKNTVAYALFSAEKISYKLKYENGKFCASNLPNDRIVQLVSLSEQNGKFFVTENKHRLTKSTNIGDVPKSKSISEIKDWLRSI